MVMKRSSKPKVKKKNKTAVSKLKQTTKNEKNLGTEINCDKNRHRASAGKSSQKATASSKKTSSSASVLRRRNTKSPAKKQGAVKKKSKSLVATRKDSSSQKTKQRKVRKVSNKNRKTTANPGRKSSDGRQSGQLETFIRNLIAGGDCPVNASNKATRAPGSKGGTVLTSETAVTTAPKGSRKKGAGVCSPRTPVSQNSHRFAVSPAISPTTKKKKSKSSVEKNNSIVENERSPTGSGSPSSPRQRPWLFKERVRKDVHKKMKQKQQHNIIAMNHNNHKKTTTTTTAVRGSRSRSPSPGKKSQAGHLSMKTRSINNNNNNNSRRKTIIERSREPMVKLRKNGKATKNTIHIKPNRSKHKENVIVVELLDNKLLTGQIKSDSSSCGSSVQVRYSSNVKLSPNVKVVDLNDLKRFTEANPSPFHNERDVIRTFKRMASEQSRHLIA